MPIFAHGLVGVGLGVATAHSARSSGCRRCWIGAAIFLAYLPDAAEWLARTVGWDRIPGSAMASAPVVLICCIVSVLVLRSVGETSRVIWIAAAGAVGSHLVLDCLDGGIPLLWPFSSRVIGPDWFELSALGLGDRLVRELILFGGAALIGIGIGLWRELSLRERMEPRAAGGWIRAMAWQSVGVSPLVVVAGVQGYVMYESSRAEAHWRRGQFAEAVPHYERLVRFETVDGISGATFFKTAYCQHRAGNEGQAVHWYQEGIRRDPDYPSLYCGLAELFLSARDQGYYRPQEIPALVEHIRRTATRAYHYRDADRFLKTARQALATRPAVGAFADRERPAG